jgi:hypothetical protein
MTELAGFDTTFDFRNEARAGEDPHSTSPTLRAYHKLLWSKPLPSGDPFDLDDTTPPFLHHLSSRGEFYLTKRFSQSDVDQPSRRTATIA